MNSRVRRLLERLGSDLTESGQGVLARGTVRWVSPRALSASEVAKSRPFCRLGSRSGRAPWIPRTTKPPREGLLYAVYTPPGAAQGLSKPGWFFVNRYRLTAAQFDPGGDDLGPLPDHLVTALEAKLASLYDELEKGR